ncbi:MAG: SusC/RagA family TonB-linked outer membrane protein [Muribaculaceae bacterium]|nr:SusC/RagA family TonB-linked outer membrane protein [Muribaculaceae bacterium]
MKLYLSVFALGFIFNALAQQQDSAGNTNTGTMPVDSAFFSQLDDVVVTAMGIKKDRRTLGYGVQHLDADQLNTAGTTSIVSAMQGRLSGVDIRPSSSSPGASAQIVIRGARSLTGNNSPLYVIDGMPVESTPDFSTGNSTRGANLADRSIDINPEDIESINVLKGQAATALYGIRASNGVIVITTRRSRSKTAHPTVTISTDIAAEVASRNFHRQEVYAQGNSPDAFTPNSAMTWGPRISLLPADATYGGDSQGHPGQYYNPVLAEAGLDGWTVPTIYNNTGDLFRTGITANTNVAVSQRTDRSDYAFGISNSYQKGIVPTTGMNRWSVRALTDIRLTDRISTGVSANYASTRIKSAPSANSAILNSVYTAPAEFNLKGTPYHRPGDPSVQVSYRPTVYDNPYWWAANNSYSQNTDRGYGNVWVEYSPLYGVSDIFSLKIREQAGLDVYNTSDSDVLEVGSAGSNKGSIDNYGVNRLVFNNLATADLSVYPGTDWDLGLLIGCEVNQDNARWWDYTGTNFNFYGMPTIGNATSYSSTEYSVRKRTVGFFSSLNAAWRSMLYLNVTGRNDYVSSMPRAHRSVFYPSVSLAWMWSSLPGLQDIAGIDYGKLRVSYAQVGQAGTYLTDYYYTPQYGSGMYTYYPLRYPVNGISAYVPYPQIYDPQLRPQNTENVEAGIEVGLFGGRLHAEYTVSYQNVTDQIFSVPTAGSTGYQYMTMNAGRMRTWSHEVLIEAILLRNADWEVTLGGNLTLTDNKVIELAPGVESLMLGGFTSPQIRAEAGKIYPIIYGTAFKRTDDSQLLLRNGLPQATAASTDLGSCSPDFVTGFNLSARWRRLSLNATLSWQHGGRMYHGTNMVLNNAGVTMESLPWHEGTFIPEGVDEITGEPNTTEVERYRYYMAYYQVGESGVYDMSFVKLRDISLTWQLPDLGPLKLQLSAFARNVLLWTRLPNFDPESSQGNGNMGGYFERFSMPATTAIGGGLKITF